MAKVIIDAGHGGEEPGAIFEGRKEKDDNLRLALAVGQILEDNGVEVVYTRTEDVYHTPFEKAQIANREDGDFLISLHRNSSPQENQYSGVETLVFDNSGKKVELAENINEALEETGFRNLGIQERPGLVILRRSQMPAVLVETGFINTPADNVLFDERFDEIAQAIADGVLRTLTQDQADLPQTGRRMAAENQMGRQMAAEGQTGRQMAAEGQTGRRMAAEGQTGRRMAAEGQMGRQMAAESQTGNRMRMEQQQTRMGMELQEEDDIYMDMEGYRRCGCMERPLQPSDTILYRVQTGAFRRREYAQEQLYQLLGENYPAYILREDGFFKVQVGAYRRLDNAVKMEQTLRRAGYPTFIAM